MKRAFFGETAGYENKNLQTVKSFYLVTSIE